MRYYNPATVMLLGAHRCKGVTVVLLGFCPVHIMVLHCGFEHYMTVRRASRLLLQKNWYPKIRIMHRAFICRICTESQS